MTQTQNTILPIFEPTETSEKPSTCDVCDTSIHPTDLCTFYITGIKEKLTCHADCVRIFYECKGDFSKLPSGRLKRSIFAATTERGSKLVRNTGITIRDKQGREIIRNLKISQEKGYECINSLAVDFYGLPKPNVEDNGEFYSIDNKKQIVLLRKVKLSDADNDVLFNITEASR
jgi:hypothetical protein